MRFLDDELLEIVPEKCIVEQDLTSAMSSIKEALNKWKRLLTNEKLQIRMDKAICKSIKGIIRERLFIGIDVKRVGAFSVDIIDYEKTYATKEFSLEMELFDYLDESTPRATLNKWADYFDELATKIRKVKPTNR